MISIDEIAKSVDHRFGSNAITDGPKTFLYLFRRFGFPSHGSDPDKAVCQYYVPLSVDGAWLAVRIGGVFAYWHFTANEELSLKIEKELRKTSGTGGELVESCKAAIRLALIDLLRPVPVMDHQITVFGEASEKDSGREVDNVSYMAGWGVPNDLFRDGDLFIDFMRWVKSQGDGDVVAGMKRIMPKGEHD